MGEHQQKQREWFEQEPGVEEGVLQRCCNRDGAGTNIPVHIGALRSFDPPVCWIEESANPAPDDILVFGVSKMSYEVVRTELIRGRWYLQLRRYVPFRPMTLEEVREIAAELTRCQSFEEVEVVVSRERVAAALYFMLSIYDELALKASVVARSAYEYLAEAEENRAG